MPRGPKNFSLRRKIGSRPCERRLPARPLLGSHRWIEPRLVDGAGGTRASVPAASAAAPSAVVSCSAATSTGRPSRSAWNCIRKRVRGRAAVGAQHAQRRPGSASTTSATWCAIASSAARTRCARRRAAREARDQPARVGVPPRRAEPGERRHEDDAVRCRRRCARAPRSRPRRRSRRARRAATAAPRPRRAPRPRARSRRRRPSASSPCGGGDASSPVCTSTKLPVPYVAFPSPGDVAALAEERRLLVACDPANLDTRAEQLALADRRRRSRRSRGSSDRSTPKSASSSSSQSSVAQRAEHRARRVRRVGHVHARRR